MPEGKHDFNFSSVSPSARARDNAARIRKEAKALVQQSRAAIQSARKLVDDSHVLMAVSLGHGTSG